MTHFHDTDDLKHLTDLKKAAPREFSAWLRFDGIVGLKDGAIEPKTRELIAVAVAHVTQCVYCLDAHVGRAREAGASRAEVAEAGLIAAALRAGGGATHAALAMRMYGEEPKGE